MSHIPIVYIVDDDLAVLKALKRLLLSWDMRVRTFTSGEDFMVALKSSSDVACSVIDIRMPKATGLEIQEQMNRAGLTVPVIFITAHEAEGIEEQAFRGGAVGFLRKPFTEKALVTLIHKAMECRPKISDMTGPEEKP